MVKKNLSFVVDKKWSCDTVEIFDKVHYHWNCNHDTTED